jgi:hypothetical protein
MSPDEIRAAIAQVKEHPAALYEFRKTCAMHNLAAMLAGNYANPSDGCGSLSEKSAARAVKHADDLIAALGLQLEPPAAEAASEEPPPVITPKEWRDPREIVVWDEAKALQWGERGKNGEVYATDIDQQVRAAIIRQIESGEDSGSVDVLGILYRFSFTP